MSKKKWGDRWSIHMWTAGGQVWYNEVIGGAYTGELQVSRCTLLMMINIILSEEWGCESCREGGIIQPKVGIGRKVYYLSTLNFTFSTKIMGVYHHNPRWVWFSNQKSSVLMSLVYGSVKLLTEGLMTLSLCPTANDNQPSLIKSWLGTVQ